MPSTTLIVNALLDNATHPTKTQSQMHLDLATAIVNSFTTSAGIIDTINGFAGLTSAGHVQIETTVTGLLLGDGTGVTAAVPGVDYMLPFSLVGSGIVKTASGVLSVALPADFPTLNQSTTGNAATATALQTARLINGVSFDGTADITISTGVLSVNSAVGAVSLTGTLNRIDVAGTAFDISASYIGQSSITTVGTIGTGVWNGTHIGVSYGGTGLTALGAALQMLRTNSGASGLEYVTLDTSIVPENVNLYFTNSRAISATLTGYVSGSGTVSATDNVLQAIQKLNGNVSLLTGAIIYQGVWNASTNTPTLVNGTGTKGYLYKVNVAGTTNIDGNSSWNVGDQIVFDGTTWDRLEGDSTEVLSVNGVVGAVIISGTPNRISVISNVIDISASYIGQSSITTVGTITTGVWNATAISDSYIASAATWNSKQAALSGSGIVKTASGIISYISGTSSQFVKGDGSLDSAVYGTIVSVSATNTTLSLSTVSGAVSAGINLSNANAWLGITSFSTTGTSSSTVDNGFTINQTLNQTLTAGSASLIINRINTVVGSSQQDFIRFQTNGVIKSSFLYDGSLNFGSTTNAFLRQGIYASTDGGATVSNGAASGSALFIGQFNNSSAVQSTSAVVTLGINGVLSLNRSGAEHTLVRIVGGLVASDTNAAPPQPFAALKFNGTINQTNSTAPCYGIKMIPTVTACSGGWSSYYTDVSSPSKGFVSAGTAINNFVGRTTIGTTTDNGTDILQLVGNLNLTVAGNGIKIKEGANATMGVDTLVNGTVTISNTKVTATSRIVFGRDNKNASAAIGSISKGTVVAGTSFVVNALNSAGAVETSDQSTFIWIIFEPS